MRFHDCLLIIFFQEEWKVREGFLIIDFSSFAVRTVRIVLAGLAVCKAVVVRIAAARLVAVAGSTVADRTVAAGRTVVRIAAAVHIGSVHMDSGRIDYSAEAVAERPRCS